MKTVLVFLNHPSWTYNLRGEILQALIEKSRGMERTNILKVHPQRGVLFEDANSLSMNAFFAKYAPYSMKVRIKNAGRYWLWRLGLQNLVRHVKHLVIHRK